MSRNGSGSRDELGIDDQRDDLPIFIHSQLDDYGLDPYEFRLYARLARRAGRNNTAHESITRMAAETGVSARKLRYSLRVLAAARLITLEQRQGRRPVCSLLPARAWRPKEDLPGIREEVGRHQHDAPEETSAPSAEVLGGETSAPATPNFGTRITATSAPESHEGTPVKVLPEGPPPLPPIGRWPAAARYLAKPGDVEGEEFYLWRAARADLDGTTLEAYANLHREHREALRFLARLRGLHRGVRNPTLQEWIRALAGDCELDAKHALTCLRATIATPNLGNAWRYYRKLRDAPRTVPGQLAPSTRPAIDDGQDVTLPDGSSGITLIVTPAWVELEDGRRFARAEVRPA